MIKVNHPIDTSDWSIALVDLGTHILNDRTLQSEQWYREFCERHGIKFVGFIKGTNPLCA